MTEKPGNPDNAQASHPPLSPEARATWGSTLIAAFSALISLVALGIGLYSAHLVEQQNSNSQQQALLSLVTDIQQGQQAPTSTNENAISAELAVLGEAEEASNIISDIPRSGVSSAEKYIVGRALEDGDDYRPALDLLTGAAQQASDPRTAADAWRGVAAILYTLKSASQAEEDVNRAEESFTGPMSPRSASEATWHIRSFSIFRTGSFTIAPPPRRSGMTLPISFSTTAIS